MGKPGMLQSMGSQSRAQLGDWTTRRNLLNRHIRLTCLFTELLWPHFPLEKKIFFSITPPEQNLDPLFSYSSFTSAAAKSLQLCPTPCNPMYCSLPGFCVHGILQARTLEWVAISFSNAWKWKVKVKSLNRVQLLAWTAAYQAPPSMGFSRQQYWSGVPLPSPSFTSKKPQTII